MMNIQRSLITIKKVLRKYSTQIKEKPVVILDESVRQELEAEAYKPRYHPGVIKAKNIRLPDSFIEAAVNTVEDHSIKKLIEDSKKLVHHLQFRLPPVERDELRNKTEHFQRRVLRQSKQPEIVSEEDLKKYKQSLTDKVIFLLKKAVYHWTPTDYNEYNALLYLFGRAAPEYAVLVKIFSEIKTRDPSFKPRSFFDFGSGIGTGTWAVNHFYKGSIFEYFNVDSSVHMNDLAQILLQGGRGTKHLQLKGVFYRQFLPAASVSYDLVLSAYTLLELPSLEARLETLQNLWRKTACYLVLVEYGTNAGFKMINEARDFILQMEGENKGHVFSPCPHDKVCPRFVHDNTPCNFWVSYQPLPFTRPIEQKTETYCFVILKKGKRSSEAPSWPRVVREVLVRSKHSICRLCTKEGNLQEIIFTANKHGKTTYHCARSSKWGDLLPISIQNPENKD
ncbi:methyltransferase-like protein 17, mitochondrial [Agrilus planipennis]|uniref:Methyltransferase-like protein 17, mitochondrial n=1 Tax=Agrilus planipennis TaxID=224129 RepID=A0A1W4X7B9_AGRPL|nr:methyltransferase-like protein 17, mitochondrial [Agrilus planipennis]